MHSSLGPDYDETMRLWLQHAMDGRPEGLNISLRGAYRRAIVGIACTLLAAVISFRLHCNLSTAGSIQLLLVVMVALRWGFTQATIVSIIAVGCLNYLFTEPIFKFSVAAPATG